MKKIFTLVTFLITFFVFSQAAYAQLGNGNTLGVRFGSAQGITYRHALSNNRALEGILSIQSNNQERRLRIVGLYEYIKPLSTNFNWYYGFGGSIGSYKGKAFTTSDGIKMQEYSETLFSVDGVIGISYTIPDVPLELSLDLKPYLDIIQTSNLKIIEPVGFSIRYRF